MSKTLGQQLNVTKFPFSIKDKRGKRIYYENLEGFWYKRQYNQIGKVIYYENSNGYWYKQEYDQIGKVIYYEESNGQIRDDRPKIT